MKFDLWTGGQKSNLPFVCKFYYFSRYFFGFLFSSYFFAPITFGDGFFQFKDNRVLSLNHVPCHNH